MNLKSISDHKSKSQSCVHKTLIITTCQCPCASVSVPASPCSPIPNFPAQTKLNFDDAANLVRVLKQNDEWPPSRTTHQSFKRHAEGLRACVCQWVLRFPQYLWIEPGTEYALSLSFTRCHRRLSRHSPFTQVTDGRVMWFITGESCRRSRSDPGHMGPALLENK